MPKHWHLLRRSATSWERSCLLLNAVIKPVDSSGCFSTQSSADIRTIRKLVRRSIKKRRACIPLRTANRVTRQRWFWSEWASSRKEQITNIGGPMLQHPQLFPKQRIVLPSSGTSGSDRSRSMVHASKKRPRMPGKSWSGWFWMFRETMKSKAGRNPLFQTVTFSYVLIYRWNNIMIGTWFIQGTSDILHNARFLKKRSASRGSLRGIRSSSWS